jgi:hypothetical protein
MPHKLAVAAAWMPGRAQASRPWAAGVSAAMTTCSRPGAQSAPRPCLYVTDFHGNNRRFVRRLPWGDLKSYLDAQGWAQVGRIRDKALVYEPAEQASGAVQILVPARDDVGDYASRMAEAVRTPADVEQRSALAVYHDITTSGADVVRLRAPSADADSIRFSASR